MLFVLPSDFLALLASSNKCHFVPLVRAVFAVLLDETRSLSVLSNATRRSIALFEIINRDHVASRHLFSVVALFFQPGSHQFGDRQKPDTSVLAPAFCVGLKNALCSPPFLTRGQTIFAAQQKPMRQISTETTRLLNLHSAGRRP